jgi:hypothetical protein
VEYGRREFSLDAVQGDGSTLRQHAKIIQDATGQIPDDYQSLPFPSILGHCWFWFLELSRSRSSGGFGQNPISYQEMKAWSELTGVRPDNIEVQAIQALDLTYLSVQAEEIRKRTTKNGRSP